MVSISRDDNVEIRHFMDDEHQLTIGIRAELWPLLQELANREAERRKWLNGRGSDGNYLNIWVIGRLAEKPEKVEPWQWVASAVHS